MRWKVAAWTGLGIAVLLGVFGNRVASVLALVAGAVGVFSWFRAVAGTAAPGWSGPSVAAAAQTRFGGALHPGDTLRVTCTHNARSARAPAAAQGHAAAVRGLGRRHEMCLGLVVMTATSHGNCRRPAGRRSGSG
ncbi:hypothetical protein [Dactylosporangium sp. CA-139066]|uniref:hypothetical protein n=1 Tax=Dactylosporangium sp. CA-139066 TaxID=3239930 RepID=UPI003D91725A